MRPKTAYLLVTKKSPVCVNMRDIHTSLEYNPSIVNWFSSMLRRRCEEHLQVHIILPLRKVNSFYHSPGVLAGL